MHLYPPLFCPPSTTLIFCHGSKILAEADVFLAVAVFFLVVATLSSSGGSSPEGSGT